MKKIGLIFLREYLTRVKKKSFIIITLLVPLGFIILMLFPILIQNVSSDSLRIAVVDESEKYVKGFKDSKTLYFKKTKKSLEDIKNTYAEENFDGVLHIPELNINNPKGVSYYSDKLLGMSTKMHIQKELEQEIRKERIAEIGVDEKAYKKASKVNIDIKEMKQDGEKASTGAATGIGFMMGFIMYFVIFIYGSMVMRGVMEEKTNRIVEVILSSVRPFQLMMGKILGIGAVGVTQFFIWIVALFFINILMTVVIGVSVDTTSISAGAASQQDPELVMDIMEGFQEQLSSLPMGLLMFSFVFYFVGGYVVYAALFASLSAAVNEEADAQVLTLPISIPVIISFFILMAILENPNTGLAFWSSIFPLSSPIIMPARIAFGVPIWQVILSMACLVIGGIFTVWLAARIYRVGILMYGKKVSFREIGKWMLKG